MSRKHETNPVKWAEIRPIAPSRRTVHVSLSHSTSLYSHSIWCCFSSRQIPHSLVLRVSLIVSFQPLHDIPLFLFVHIFLHLPLCLLVSLFLFLSLTFPSLTFSLLAPSLGDMTDSGCCHLGMMRAVKRWIKQWMIHTMPCHTNTHTHAQFPQSIIRNKNILFLILLSITFTNTHTHFLTSRVTGWLISYINIRLSAYRPLINVPRYYHKMSLRCSN